MLSLYVFYCNILNVHEKALWTTTVCWSLLDRSEPKSNAWLHIVQCRYVHVCTKFTDFFTDWLLSKNGLCFFPSVMKQQELDSLSLSMSLCNDKTSSPSLHSQHCSSEVGQPCWSESEERFSSSGAFVLVPVFYHKHTHSCKRTYNSQGKWRQMTNPWLYLARSPFQLTFNQSKWYIIRPEGTANFVAQGLYSQAAQHENHSNQTVFVLLTYLTINRLCI